MASRTALYIAAALAALTPLLPPAEAALPPEGIHLATAGDPRSDATVTWRIPGADTTQGIDYGATATYGAHLAAASPATGIYSAHLTGLPANATVHYRVGSAASGWSADHAFRTAPAGRLDRAVRIGLVGDTGDSTDTRAAMARLAAANLDAVVHAGDHTYLTGGAGWDTYMRDIQQVAAGVPYLGVVGNHDVESCCGLSYFTSRFAFPGNELWWSADLGNVHLVVLDDEPSSGDGAHFSATVNLVTPGTAQYDWLSRDLAAAKATGRYLVVAFHRPVYSSNAVHPSNLGMRASLEPLFDSMGVDLVVNGHSHNYERTYPVKAGAVQDGNPNAYVRGKGPIYLVTGAGGESLYDSWQAKPAWSAVRTAVYEWVEVEATRDGALRVVAHRTSDNGVIDAFTIAPAQAPAPTPAPGGAFPATFALGNVNEWWVDAKVASPNAVASVAAAVNGGALHALAKTAWGSWAASFNVPKGSTVVFTAKDAAGNTATSPAFPWLTATPTPTPAPTAAFAATFTPKTLTNHWWVETGVASASAIAKVEARLNGGAWTQLPKTSWGTYAKSLSVPAGTQLVFRATDAAGATATSATYTEK